MSSLKVVIVFCSPSLKIKVIGKYFDWTDQKGGKKSNSLLKIIRWKYREFEWKTDWRNSLDNKGKK